jgi:hypothetical protein
MPKPLLAACTLFALAGSSLVATADDKPAKTETVKIQDVELAVPADWKRTEPSSNLRLAQFDIPAAKGDTEATQLVVYSFPGGGGGVDPNLQRWLGEFTADGRKVDLVQGTAPQGKYVLASVAGKHQGTSFARRDTALDDGRLLGAIITVEGKGIYFLKMVGQDATVKAATEAFRNSFGADAKKETKYEPSL